MHGEAIPVEKLSCGLDAVFINLPHFRTHAARLMVNAGSAHETPEAHGAAHFLEHVVFQGTEDMPTEEDVHHYTEAKGLNKNASTSNMTTTYMADGYELDSVGFMVTQVALKPNLYDEALEGERKPISDEMNMYFSSPYHWPNVAHETALRGYEYARPVIGETPEDIVNMRPQDLRDFYNRHYRVGNMVLVMCSAEPVEEQRELAEILTSDIDIIETSNKLAIVEFDRFNPNRAGASLQTVNLPETAQTGVSIFYEMPEAKSPQELMENSLLGVILSGMAHRRLRREMALCYGATANVAVLTDMNFARGKSWSQLNVSANLDGKDAIEGLTALKDEVLGQEISENIFRAALISFKRDTDHLMEGNPAFISGRVCNMLSAGKREEVRLEELEELARNVSLNSIRSLHERVLSSQPLITASSPSEKVLAEIGTWAESL